MIKKKRIKIIATVLLSLGLALSLSIVPDTVNAWAAEGEQEPVSYIYRDENNTEGEERTCSEYTLVTENSGMPSEFTNGWYVFKRGSIDCDFRPEIYGNDVNFILEDGCRTEISKGIRIDMGRSHLTIYGQKNGTGTIVVESSKNSPLGSNQNYSGYSSGLTINGGYIYAEGGNGAAAIGAGKEGSFGDITINGGHVEARGGGDAAGIGGSENGEPFKTITINGGLVDAIGGSSRGAGIGSGDQGENGGRIKITGGTVNAYGGGGNEWNGALEQGRGAGIGGGQESTGPDEIIISGGKVRAEGSWYGAGIGGGYEAASGDITITGGEIEAVCGDKSAGIGGGSLRGIGNEKRVKITGGNVKVTVGDGNYSTMDYFGAGIGGGESSPQGGDIIIEGGEVSAESWSGAGIGGGGAYGKPGGNVTISGGTVAARSRTGAGIGGGGYGRSFNEDYDQGDGGNVIINGGVVFSSSTEGGAAIGGGAGRNGGAVTIRDGYVVAITSAVSYDWTNHIKAKYTGNPFGDIASIIANLLMKEFLSDPQGRSPAAIGGGFVDTPQGGRAGSFTMTGGTLIAKSGINTTPAIGKGSSNNGPEGTYEIADDMAVLSSDDMSVEPLDMEHAPIAERLRYVKEKSYIMIEKCKHETKEYHDQGSTHTYDCIYCKYISFSEPHEWRNASYTWTEDNSKVTGKLTCGKCAAVKSDTVDTTGIVREPTCQEPGERKYIANFKVNDPNTLFETQTKTVEIPVDPEKHDWNEPTYVWAEDNGSVTAKRVCKNNSSHVQTETVETTSQITKPATCEDKGETTYSATFENEAFKVQKKTVDNIDPIGHAWGEPTYEWAEDNSSVTAIRVCTHDASHKETETATATSEVTKPATCEDKGETTYTSAAFETDAFKVQTKTVEDIDALGHDWGEPTYKWADDNKSVTATRICARDGEHVETETATATSEVTKPATCEGKGETTYTSSDFTNEAFTAQTKTVGDIDALGHDWDDWTETTAPTCTEKGVETRVCKRDESHKETHDIDALGHEWGDWTKLDDQQHQRFCKHDKNHVETGNHKWDAGKITKKATEKATGIKTYTCTICKATKTETIPKLKPTPTPTPTPTPSKKAGGTLIAKMTAKGNTGMLISWNKVNGASGYDIFLARCNHGGRKYTCKRVKTIKGNKTFRWTKTGLKKGVSYKGYVKAYVTKNGKKTYVSTSPYVHAYGGSGTKKYTNAKSLTVNRSNVSLKKGKTFKITSKIGKVQNKKALMPKSHVSTLRYKTSAAKIATVSKSGKITAKGKGTCYVYVFTHNGVSARIKVTVK